MKIENIALPEIYLESSDFRLFVRWFAACLSKVQYDTENMPDLYDPLRCPENLLWMLADTMGFKYDDRLPTAFNRLVLIYFMSMIRTRGSRDGITLAAEVNLAQFNIINYGKEKDIFYNRLEDTSIPVNSVYVTPHTAEGYIDVVYFSENNPIDACIEYVRPVGMYLFATPGVRCDARTKISIDSRLTNLYDGRMSIGSTRVGRYTRKDYASLQKVSELPLTPTAPSGSTTTSRTPVRPLVPTEDRELAWHRNSKAEGEPTVNAGYRALSSLQLCNNDHIVKALIPSLDPDTPPSPREAIFGLGYTPTQVEVFHDKLPLQPEDAAPYTWNLRYDRSRDYSINLNGRDVFPVATLESDTAEGGRESTYPSPTPRINPIMMQVGDAIAMNDDNTKYTKATTPSILVDVDDNEIVTENTNADIDVTGQVDIEVVDVDSDND